MSFFKLHVLDNNIIIKINVTIRLHYDFNFL